MTLTHHRKYLKSELPVKTSNNNRFLMVQKGLWGCHTKVDLSSYPWSKAHSLFAFLYGELSLGLSGISLFFFSSNAPVDHWTWHGSRITHFGPEQRSTANSDLVLWIAALHILGPWATCMMLKCFVIHSCLLGMVPLECCMARPTKSDDHE